ncbi:MAG TPA: hypothetical protein VKX17_01585 [Planctomycetota bacterium]|nr:hypothetical protein [Planctomycetota bacterium]
MSPSSIFNFESLHGLTPRVPKALLIAAALVLTLELALRLAPDRWLLPYSSRLGLALYMEHEVLPRFDHPQIAIFGTSRAADAFSPVTLDEALNLPPYSSVNLSIFSGRTNEWFNFYQRNRAKLSKVKVLVVAVDEWTFSSGVTADEQLSISAPFIERWNFVQTGEAPPHPEESPDEKSKRAAATLDYMRTRRNLLLVDWLFQMRMKLAYLPKSILVSLHLAQRHESIALDADRMVRSPGTEVESLKQAENSPISRERIKNYYKHFNSHPLYIAYFEELAALAKADGVRLLVLQMPNRRSYQNEVDKLFPEEYEQHIRVTRDLAAKVGASFKSAKFPEEISADGKTLTDANYKDYGHMVPSGTDICTRWLADIIKNEALLK